MAPRWGLQNADYPQLRDADTRGDDEHTSLRLVAGHADIWQTFGDVQVIRQSEG